MQRPCLLNADAAGSLSYREGLSVAAALSLKDNALEYLNSLTVSFLDLTINLYGITNFKLINGPP